MDLKNEQIIGHLNHIRFQNDKGFLIGIFQGPIDIGEFTSLGSIVNPQVGIDYKLFGKWMNDPQWGKQFKFKTFEIIKPKSTDGIYRYIVRACRWVGPSVGKRLIDVYKEKTLDVLRENPKQVAADIKGITYVRAIEIQADIKKNEEIEATLVELEKLVGNQGLRASLPMDLVQKWGANAVKMIEINPYILTEMKNVGFPSADKIAINKIKVDPKSINRQKAAILHILNKDLFNGNTWMISTELFKQAKALISWSIKEGFDKLISDKRVKEVEGHIALNHIAKNEKIIAQKIQELMSKWI